MSNQPALVPSGRVSRSRVRVSRTSLGPSDAPDRIIGMITPWSVGTPMKPTWAASVFRSSTAGAPKKVLVAGRVSGPTGSSLVACIPFLLLPECPHDGITVHNAGASPSLIRGGREHEAAKGIRAIGRTVHRPGCLRWNQQPGIHHAVEPSQGQRANQPAHVGTDDRLRRHRVLA